MIDWITSPDWVNYNIRFFKSQKFGLGCAVVYEANEDTAHADRLIEMYCKFQMAHIVHNPLILLSVDSNLSKLGAPLFNILPGHPVLYHLPKSCYPFLEDMVDERAILLNEPAVTMISPFQNFIEGLFKSPEEFHLSEGLLIIGMVQHADTTETNGDLSRV